jgi:hypothetical protein
MHIGSYKTKDEAAASRRDAELRYGFTGRELETTLAGVSAKDEEHNGRDVGKPAISST